MIGPGALSQTRLSRVTVTLGTVGSVGLKRKHKYKERACVGVYGVCVSSCG